jgi:hypothetical protein
MPEAVQGIEIPIHPKKNASAMAAVPTVGSAPGDEFLPVKMHHAVAAPAGAYRDIRFI